jgi:uncharacterized heparinase superfamily protein
MSKVALYLETARHLNPKQVTMRIWRSLGGKTCLPGWTFHEVDFAAANASRVPVLPELDFDPAFLTRFDADAIMSGRLDLLHVAVDVDWASPIFWRAEAQAPLWRFNLHYHEYLLPLAKQYLVTGSSDYIKVAKRIVYGWMDANPCSAGGPGWDPYTISMRVVNWIALRAECSDAFIGDHLFCERMDRSLAEQASFLASHMECDILANHYLEECKALVLLGVFLSDWEMLSLATKELELQVREQVYPDGGHFELSPMYQKIVLEDLLRVAVALRAVGKPSQSIEDAVSRMCDFAWSLERGLSRTPLFNDSGDNVAKSLQSLLACARHSLCIEPQFCASFPDSGFEVLESSDDRIKCIFKTGRANPPIAMAHMHCDALSFELFLDGKPVIENCGTFVYQGDLRPWFRSTAASTGVSVGGCEQHECWSQFRVARYGNGGAVQRSENCVVARFADYKGNESIRRIKFSANRVIIETTATDQGHLSCYYHLAQGLSCNLTHGEPAVYLIPEAEITVHVEGASSSTNVVQAWRSSDFGVLERGQSLVVESCAKQTVIFDFFQRGVE